jgi:hypothetical protein
MPARLLFALVFCFPCLLFAQPLPKPSGAISLTTGTQHMQPASSAAALTNISAKGAWDGRYIWMANFAKAPSVSDKSQCEKEGVSILAKINAQTYFVSTATVPTLSWLQQHNILQTAVADAKLKLHKGLTANTFPADAKDEAGRLVALVTVQPKLPMSAIKQWLKQHKFQIDSTAFENDARVLTVHFPLKQLMQLAEAPFTLYIQPVQKERLLNEKARFFSGAFMANAPISAGGHNLNGKGVVVGVGDIGDAGIHPDLAGRVNAISSFFLHPHGAHVSGTIAGAGLLQPDRKGLAPMATLLNHYLRYIWMNARQYFDELGMVLTNNSYALAFRFGEYDTYSYLQDQLAYDVPVVLNIFASGNSGDEPENPYLRYYGTVWGGMQSAKNVITVGRVDYDQLASSSSSCGPVNDGRIKPEIMSLGVVQSTDEYAGYNLFYGTSQAAPGVTGGLALLYERYRQLFNGQNPQGALMKAILLNGARDIGARGPDYRHGYGLMHLENSLRILDKHYYKADGIATGIVQDTAITVPNGLSQLKVMLYWHDAAALPYAEKALVNDLDLEVKAPDGSTIVYPKKLNFSPQNVADLATEGADHVNNSEQVVIDAPLPGKYILRVKGYDVSGTPNQPYQLCFDYVPKGLVIRTPVAADSWSVWEPTETGVGGVVISWDDEGTGTGGDYTLEYSLNAGSSWNVIPADTLQPAVPLVLKDTYRYYGWRPLANTSTNQAMVRVTKNGTAFSATSGVFSILNRPSGVVVTKPCEGYLSLQWKPVMGADDYEVIMKQGLEMLPVGVADSTCTYTLKGLSRDSTYYVAVRARKAGIPGRYMYANAYVPNSGPCAGSISDGDLKLDSIITPISGRQFTSSALGAAESIKIRVKNLDNIAVDTGSYEIKYRLDNGPFVSLPGGAIKALSTYTCTFTGADFSALGPHTVTAVVTNIAFKDSVPKNDTFTTVVKNISNPLIVLSTDVAASFLEDFETAASDVYQNNTIGLSALDHWDYYKTKTYDRARTYVQKGFAFSGSQAISLDESHEQTGGSNHRLEGTFNLSGASLNDEVRLDFQYKVSGGYPENVVQNGLWVRGSEKDAWISVGNLFPANQPQSGNWKKTKSIELNDLLAAANPAQQFSATTQLRFGQSRSGQVEFTGGSSFDDVRIYLASNDLELASLELPTHFSCMPADKYPIKITVRNNMAYPISGVNVSYKINDGEPVVETIQEAIPANGELRYEFASQRTFQLSADYSVTASVDYPGDNVLENNAVTKAIEGNYAIDYFPYNDPFYEVDGGFRASGVNASWQWGVPKGKKIDTAASYTQAWKTSLTGNYNDNERSYLTSPCFDISNLANPTLSFGFAYDLEDCQNGAPSCDSAWMEYSTDGINWYRLGTFGQGTNWYDNSQNVWTGHSKTHWHAATTPLPKTSTLLSFRFVMSSNGSGNYEGLAIDDLHIYDLPMPMYTKTGESEAVVQNVSGGSWIDFSAGGRLIASIYPDGKDFGNTEVKAYIFDGPVRNNYGSQYYGNRSITIKPTNKFTEYGGATVRLYFTDKEIDSLRLANSCPTCTQLKDYSHIGVTQYTDADKANEDGSLENNTNGVTQYYSSNDMWLSPYDSGYVIQLYVTDFSEFWLNDGKGANIPLPNTWITLKASKQNEVNGRLEWQVNTEYTVDYYEIQRSKSKPGVGTGIFETINKIFARNSGLATYNYVDEQANTAGDNYYRIRQVMKDGQIFYSPVRMLSFGKLQFDITLRPNPVKDNLWLAVQSDKSKSLQVKIVNMTGQTVYQQNWPVAAGTSQFNIPVSKLALAQGVYSIGVGDGKSWWYGKVLKQ